MTSRKVVFRLGCGLFLGATLSACSHTPPKSAGHGNFGTYTKGDSVLRQDGAPEQFLTDAQIAQLSDAVPVDEPLSRYGNTSPYTVLGETYKVMSSAKGFRQNGLASWYGRKFHGQRTSSGEQYDMFKMTAAHRNLPIPCYVRVTNRDNGKSVILKVNDRGPFHSDRVMDVSWAAAAKLGMLDRGTANVSIETINPDASERPVVASAQPAPVSAPSATPEADTNQRFFVQAGAFGSAENAAALQNRLLTLAAAPVAIQRSDDPTSLHRVQVGPFSDEASAEKARDIIREASVGNPIIVKR